MINIGPHVEALKKSKNITEALEVYGRAVESFGFQHYTFIQLNNLERPTVGNYKLLKTTYPKEWQDRYIDQLYFEVDPIHHRMLACKEPCYWSEYLKTASLCPKAQVMLDDARSYGIVDGVVLGYTTHQGETYAITMSTNRLIEASDLGFLASIYLLTAYLVAACENNRQNDQKSPNLTKKEKDIIGLASLGKTDQDIATISNISVHTVRYHWKNIFQKLNTYSRIFAVLKSISLGLVEVSSFELTTNNGKVIKYKKAV